jgi:phage terminase large subunit-like protein
MSTKLSKEDKDELRAAHSTPYRDVNFNQRESIESYKTELISRAQMRDTLSEGLRYKSEARSCVYLLVIYFGDQKIAAKGDENPCPFLTRILGQFRTFEQWLELRHQARTDLFWLGKTIFRKDFVDRTHRVVCEQFVQKKFGSFDPAPLNNNDVPKKAEPGSSDVVSAFREGYSIGDVHKAINRQERFDASGRYTKDMILLDPRGFFKSTIDGIDSVQWMINVPDIRIFILTGENRLALAFMKEIKQYLCHAPQANYTDFQLLFPEYILTGVDGTSKEPIWLPCRKHEQKEGSLWVNSIDSNLSGWHCDVRKSDDFVTDENCNTLSTRTDVNYKFDGSDNLLDEWGFSDSIGTRYHPLKKTGLNDEGEPVWDGDWYAIRLQRSIEDPENAAVKYFCRAAFERNPGFEDVPLRKLTQDMVTLNFPEKSTWTSLKKKMKNERQFRCQQLNDPPTEEDDSKFKVTFDEDILRRHMIQSSEATKLGEVYICWDWASTANKTSDYSVGVAARVIRKYPEDPNSPLGLLILEIDYAKSKPSELAFRIVNFNKRWNPRRTLIEKSNGAELLQLEIQRQAVMYGVSLDIFWKTPSNDDNAKRNRIKGLETLLADDRLWFVMGPWIDETFNQMTKYTGEKKNRGKKDDIPDAMAYATFFLPSSALSNATEEERKKIQEDQDQQARQKAQYDRVFNVNSFSPPAPAAPQPMETPTDPRRAAMQKIFGGNGIRA